MSDTLPGKGLFGWLGRQVGHVRKAVQTDPAAPLTTTQPKVVYRENRIEEQQLPNQPGVRLRRTVIDEVVVDASVARQIAESQNGRSTRPIAPFPSPGTPGEGQGEGR
jgi:hypothetical protein